MSAHRHSDNPVCPHCGHQHIDAWDWEFGPGIEGDTETECGECEKPFHVFRHAHITYSTIPIVPIKKEDEK